MGVGGSTRLGFGSDPKVKGQARFSQNHQTCGQGVFWQSMGPPVSVPAQQTEHREKRKLYKNWGSFRKGDPKTRDPEHKSPAWEPICFALSLELKVLPLVVTLRPYQSNSQFLLSNLLSESVSFEVFVS